jgi:carotenoid cleavage dioxygenase-like enzyme
LPGGITAHPKLDPLTGELIVFRYDVVEPFLTWAVIGADGTVTRQVTAVDGVDQPYMIHDCAITARYLVLVLGPLTLDVGAMLSGGSALQWKPEDGTRIALVPRDGSAVHWAHGDAFWAWHYANAYDDGDVVQVDLPWTTAPSIVLTGPDRTASHGGFSRATIDPRTGTIAVAHLDDVSSEFPRIDDRLVGARHRYVLIASRSDDARVAPGEHDQLYRYDTTAGTSVRFDAGGALGEPVFVPRDGSTDELDGYYLAYRSSLTGDATDLVVFDAATFPAEPVCTVRMPRRVPNGLHGNWFPA